MTYYNNNILKGGTEQDTPQAPREGERERVGQAISEGGKPKEGKSNKRELRGAEKRKVNSLHLTFPLRREEGGETEGEEGKGEERGRRKEGKGDAGPDTVRRAVNKSRLVLISKLNQGEWLPGN